MVSGFGQKQTLKHVAPMAAVGRKRAFTHSSLSFLELLTIALMGKRFQVIWQLQLRVGGGFNQEMASLPRAADTESVVHRLRRAMFLIASASS